MKQIFKTYTKNGITIPIPKNRLILSIVSVLISVCAIVGIVVIASSRIPAVRCQSLAIVIWLLPCIYLWQWIFLSKKVYDTSSLSKWNWLLFGLAGLLNYWRRTYKNPVNFWEEDEDDLEGIRMHNKHLLSQLYNCNLAGWTAIILFFCAIVHMIIVSSIF